MAEPIRNNFVNGLNKDISKHLLPEGSYFHAKNAVNNTHEGNQYTLSTEAAKLACITLPYTLIGAIPLDGGQWCVFTTNDVDSEIGIADIDNCTYTTLTHNQPCLNFNRASLITGASRRNFDCGFSVYWSDGARNPDRVIDTNDVPWVQTDTTPLGPCHTFVPTTVLDCDKLRIAPLLKIPCLKLAKSNSAGTLLNGTYQVAIAYAINSIKVTDYVILSNPESIFSHNNVAGSLTLTIDNTDSNFREMQLVVVSFINQNLTAKILGIFNTDEKTIHIDHVDPTLVDESISDIPIQAVPIEKSDSIWSVNNFLIRNGIYEKPDFNYQPLANQIEALWACVDYPDTYYGDGGHQPAPDKPFYPCNVGYMRDEVYCFFIRFVYTDGSKSASYHIPGRGFNTFGCSDGSWTNNNTGQLEAVSGVMYSTLPDGGYIGSTGRMGYWQSDDIYPDDKPQIWNSNVLGHPEWDLCGKPIRHHKFPDQTVQQYVLSHFNPGTEIIRILGVFFKNIHAPLLDPYNPSLGVVPNIVGYEILRGSREGNKSIIAKGILNNMCKVPKTTGQDTIFQNYPYNDLRKDPYLTANFSLIQTGGIYGNTDPLSNQVQHNLFSFHSPDTSFQHPFIGTPVLKIYTEFDGKATGSFSVPYHHPEFKVPTNFDSALTHIISVSIIGGQIATIMGGGGFPNMSFSGTDSLPWSIPLFTQMIPPDMTSTPLYDGIYWANVIFNTALFVSLTLIEFNVLKEKFLQIIAGLIPAHQYARQFNSHAFYDNINSGYPSINLTTDIDDHQYVEGGVQSFGGFTINNLFRNNYLLLQTHASLSNCSTQDTTRYTICDVGGNEGEKVTPTSCIYGGLKVPFASQYGQIGSVRQLPITSCIYVIGNSPVLFGGDTYINRYTEKNPFLFFNDWLINTPSDFSYDYRNSMNVAYPAYWIDNRHSYTGIWDTASDYRRLDCQPHDVWSYLGNSFFYVSKGYFYLFCNGVREFYVESDVNVGYRDWGEQISERFYDHKRFTDLESMFRSDVIRGNILYKYDYSLSVSKFYTQYISFGSVLDRDYDPYLAYTCYNYYPRRVIYSLPQNEELKLDNWRNFLPNNFYDFYTPVTAIKTISKTGALFMMKEQSPVMFTGVQTLQQGQAANVEITIGDGGLFNQSLQNVVNTDKGIGYGSCVSKYSIVNTPHGLFWASQRSGKIFSYSEQMEEISSLGLKWWFATYLPSFLLQQFPNYPLYDNPVAGVGVQISYDETSDILYVSKRDFKFLGDANSVSFRNDGSILYHIGPHNSQPIYLTDPDYFENCSFKVSYDCKIKKWISFHTDRHGLVMNTRNHNMAEENNILYVYNNRTDLFNDNFEIGFPVNTGNTVTTLKNIEWFCESWFYHGQDKNQVFDNCFDNAIVWTDDQNSGRLQLTPKSNNPYTDLQYPILAADHTDILYSLKENKYRINAFTDFTRDRQSLTSSFTSDNSGINITLNPLYFDFAKPPLQQKRLRGYNFNIFLQKLKSNTFRQNLRLTQNQVLNSQR